MKSNRRIAVIGGGISGLTSAYWLKKNGLDVTLFEQSSHLGGSILTEKIDGFLIDYGPNSTLETSDILRELIDELGLTDQKVYGNEASNKRYIVKNGYLYSVPMSPGSFLITGLFSLKAKLKLLKEPFIRKTSGEDISLADFVKHRLGKEFLDYAINPFVAGVYAGDPEQLSTAAGFPKLYALEQKYGSLIKGAIMGSRERKKRKEVAKDRARLFSFRDGMEVLPAALAKELDSSVCLNTGITRLEKKNGAFIIATSKDGKEETLLFDELVTAIPAASLSGLLKNIDGKKAGIIKEINYPPVAVVFMGFKKEDVEKDIDGFGFLVPEVENRNILGSIWSSSIFPNRSPDGYVAFTTFVGGARQPGLALQDYAVIEKNVMEDLKDLVGIKGNPNLIKIRRWPHAIPQYKVGYLKVQEIFDQIEKDYPGLYIAGNIRRGISVGDSVLCANDAVQKIIKK